VTQNSTSSTGDSAFATARIEESRSQANDFGIFFRKFIQKGRNISAATPSSRWLAEAVCRDIDFAKPATIVELGAGTGAVTEVLLDRLRAHHRFVAVEYDADFCDIFRQRFPSVDLIEGDASVIEGQLAHRGISKVDYVLSGLPTPNLPTRSVVRLMRWMRNSLTPDGVFAQITVVPLVYRRFYRRLFSSVEFDMVWLNAPPGGVYQCRSIRNRPHPARRRPRSGRN